MTQINPSTLINMPQYFVACLLLSVFLSACNNEKSSTIEHTTPQREENYQHLFDQAIHCAALIAINEQINNNLLSSDSEAFKWVGFTLGQANNYKIDGNLSVNTQEQYSNKTLELFLQYKQQKTGFDRNAHDHCIEQAKIYDPETQMTTILKKAEKMRSKNTQ